MRQTVQMFKIGAALTIALTLAGCGLLRFGGEGSGLGDGQLDLLTLLGLVGSAQSGDYSLLCETVLAAQGKTSEAEAQLLAAACRGLLAKMAPATAAAAMGGGAVPLSVVASSTPAGPACDELRIAFDIAANACGW